jgi:hypothetical protein
MKRELFQLYKIGRELGLTKKEIDKVCLYDNFIDDNFMDKYFGGFILIMILMFIIVLVIVSCLSVPPYVSKNNTYQTGTLYSTVRIKDFNEKR